MKESKRFEKIYTQGTFEVMEIWVDTKTGVNYLFRQSAQGGGMAVLIDRDGKPVVSPVNGIE